MSAVKMRAVSFRSGVSVALLLLGCESPPTSAENGGGAPSSGGSEGNPASGTGPASDAGTSTGGLPAMGGQGPARGGDGNEGGRANPGGMGPQGGVAGGGEITAPAGPLINGIQWADDAGAPIQAHGGGVIRVGDDYFWFGENRTPDGKFNAVSVYRSRDLQRWHLQNSALKASSAPELSPSNVERPKVVYNATTKKYVMWMHWENGAGYGEARAAVASSDKVDGDYTYHGSFRPLADSGVMDHGKPGYMSRDCGLFVDDDGKGYFISASNENYDLNLYELSADYLSIAGLVGVLFKGGHREAPVLFKREGTYFLLTSGATGWDPNQARYATSKSLASGWSALADIGDATTFHSQPTYVLPVQGSASTSYLYLGDRWAGAWDGRVKDSTYVWQPLTFASPTTIRMSWNNTLRVDAAKGSLAAGTRRFRITNQKTKLALQVEAGNTTDGAPVAQAADAAGENQAWNLDYDGAGYFRLTNQESRKVLEVKGESTADGAAISQWTGGGGDHQAWLAIDLGDGQYWLRNKKSSKLLGAQADSDSAIEQRADSDADEQRWRLTPIE